MLPSYDSEKCLEAAGMSSFWGWKMYVFGIRWIIYPDIFYYNILDILMIIYFKWAEMSVYEKFRFYLHFIKTDYKSMLWCYNLGNNF